MCEGIIRLPDSFYATGGRHKRNQNTKNFLHKKIRSRADFFVFEL